MANNMSDVSSADDELPLDLVAEEFVTRYRHGERPSISEYITRHPDLAREIRELIPALVMMEDARPTPESGTAGLTDVKGNCLERLGEYRILREIGRGGMGIVYEAEQESLGRRVALKILPRHAMLDSRQLERFHRESRSAARLHHTNIVPVFGIGEQDGLHYHVMQLIEGCGLDQVLREVMHLRNMKSGVPATADAIAIGSVSKTASERSVASTEPSASSRFQLPGHETTNSDSGTSYWASVARIGVQVADALAYATSQGVLHRDIKPSNLMLDANGIVWVTDFGLAKASGSEDLTQTGDIVGTISYMAPERLNGESDQRSDIYSLGITLYEMLTLRHPFAKSDRQQLIRQISLDEPPAPRTIDATLPRDLETIILKAIARQPSDRYQSAEMLAADLRRFLDDQPIHARRIGVLERGWRMCRRNPIVVGLTAVIVLLATAVSVGLPVLHILRSDRDRAVASQQRATVAEKQALLSQDRAERAEREVSIRAYMAQATAIRRSGKMGQRFDCLNEIALAVRLQPTEEIRNELRAEAIAALALTDLRVSSSRIVGTTYGAQCDSQLQRYAVVDFFKSGDTIVRELNDDRELLRVSKPPIDFWHAVTEFSADGRYLLVTYFPRLELAGNSILHCWDLQENEKILNVPIRSADVISSATTSGPLLFYVNRQSELCLWNMEERHEQKRMPLGMTPYNICVNSDRSRVAVNDRDTSLVRILDLNSGAEISSWTTDVGRYGMAWSSDEQLLATATDDGRIFVQDVQAGRLRFQLESAGTNIRLQFAHNGHLLASNSWEFSTRLWDASSGRELVTTEGHFLRFSQDDQRVAFARGGSIGIWELAHNTEIRYFQGTSAPRLDRADRFLADAVFSPDGHLLVTYGHGGIWFWDRATGAELGHVESGNTISVLFRKDSKSIIVHSADIGIYEWPIRMTVEDEQEILGVGPPKLLHALNTPSPFPLYGDSLAWLPDQRSVAYADNQLSQVVVISADQNDQLPRVLFRLPSEHARMTNIAVSADGLWAAAGGWKEQSIQVWSLTDRKLARKLPHSDHKTDTRFWVRFSPDNRWLMSAAASAEGSGYLATRVGTWERGFCLPAETISSPIAEFAGEGKFMAIHLSRDFISIADSIDGSELMRFSISHRGTFVAALSENGEELVLHMGLAPSGWWNLLRVNQQLQAIGLGWGDAEELRSTAPPKNVLNDSWVAQSKSGRRQRLNVDSGDFSPRNTAKIRTDAAAKELQTGRLQAENGNLENALAAFERALALSPDDGLVMNEVSWTIVKSSSGKPEQYQRALELAIRVNELQPDQGHQLNTLGVALFRNKKWTDAIAALKRSEELSSNRLTFHNSYFLAMCSWQLGDHQAALEWYEKAAAWKTANPDSVTPFETELQEFHKEAASLLKKP